MSDIINSPPKSSDLKAERSLILILALHLGAIAFFASDLLGLKLPFIRPLISLIYLLYAPGRLIIGILDIKSTDKNKTILYSIGLSVLVAMVIGLFINIFLPIIGIYKPLTKLSLYAAYVVLTSLLLILNFAKRKNFELRINLGKFYDKNSFIYLFLVIIFDLVIGGVFLENYYNVNIVLIFFLLSISILYIYIVSIGFVSDEIHALAIFVVSLSLLYQTSLISAHLWGWDIQTEYYFSNLALTEGYWDSSISNPVNGVLSVVILAPVISIICDIQLVTIFKLIYPFLFSLTAVTLLYIYRVYFNNKVALMSCFFFISLFTFYTEMLQLARQEIAELFLVLFILSLVDKDLELICSNRSILLILFGFGTVVSHYGVSYVFLLILIPAWLVKRVSTNCLNYEGNLNINLVLFFFVTCISWYMYVSHSYSFETIILMIRDLVNSISKDLFNPEAIQGLSLVTTQVSPILHIIAKYIHLISQAFISLGIIELGLEVKRTRDLSDFSIFAILFYFIFLLSLGIPQFSAMNISRLYHMGLIFLSPFCIIGGLIIFHKLIYIISLGSNSLKYENIANIALAIFLSFYLLFNSGFMYQVFEGSTGSISLNNSLDTPYFHETEVRSALWLKAMKGNNTIFADEVRKNLLSGFFRGKEISENINSSSKNEYTFLGKRNLQLGDLTVGIPSSMGFLIIAHLSVKEYSENLNIIYSNGGSEILAGTLLTRRMTDENS